MRRWSAVLAALAVVVAGPASAETVERAVKANQRTAVGGVFTYELESCRAAEIPNLSFRTQPSHGTVAIYEVTIPLGPHTTCAGRKVKGPALVYTPTKGFKGQDQFTIEYPFPTNHVRGPTVFTRTFLITVE